MNYYFESTTNPITLNPNPFFLKPSFKFKIDDCFLKLSNVSRVVQIWLNLLKNDVFELVNFTMNIGDKFFINSNTVEIIQAITLADNTILNLPILIKKDMDNIRVYVKYSYLVSNGYNILILYNTKVDNGVKTEDLQLISDDSEITSFDYLKPEILKLRLIGDNLQCMVYEIKDSAVTKSNLMKLVNADDDLLGFNTDFVQNPYGLINYSFEIVDQNNVRVNIEKFSGILKLVRN